MNLADYKNKFIQNIAIDYHIDVVYLDPSIGEVAEMTLKFDQYKVTKKITVINILKINK